MKLAISKRVLHGFLSLVKHAIETPEKFSQEIAWGSYNHLISDLIGCDPRLNVPSDVDYRMVKRVVARIAMAAEMDITQVNEELARSVLVDVLVEMNTGEECWLIYVPIPGPWGPLPVQRLKGAGSVLSSTGKTVPFDLNLTSDSDLLVTSLFEYGVDNSVGAPTLDKFPGLRVRYVWKGRAGGHGDESINAVYERFASISCLWIDELFVPLAAIEYPLSLCPTSLSKFLGQTPSIPQEYGPLAKPHVTISERRQFDNLWDFVCWFNDALQRMPQGDRNPLMVALHANRSAHFAASTTMFVIQSSILAEALLGGDRELSRTIAQRAAWVLGYDRDEEFRRYIFHEEKEFYELRSKLVHGRFGESELKQVYDVETCHDKIDGRNRELILRALEIERTQELKLWADANLLA